MVIRAAASNIFIKLFAVGLFRRSFKMGKTELATGQFEISDERSPEAIANLLRQLGLEPVWKDWEQALSG